MRKTTMLFSLGSAAAVAAAATALGVTGGAPAPATLAATSQQASTGASGADQAAISYVASHYPGPGQARVLATEPDTERGQAVYDVRVLAPDGTVYVVHVSRAGDAVLWADRAESQAAGPSGKAVPPAQATSGPDNSPDQKDSPDHRHSQDG